MLTVTTNRYRDGVASLVRLWSGVAIIGALCFLGFSELHHLVPWW